MQTFCRQCHFDVVDVKGAAFGKPDSFLQNSFFLKGVLSVLDLCTPPLVQLVTSFGSHLLVSAISILHSNGLGCYVSV